MQGDDQPNPHTTVGGTMPDTGTGTLDGLLPATPGVAERSGTDALDRRVTSGISICREQDAGKDAQS